MTINWLPLIVAVGMVLNFVGILGIHGAIIILGNEIRKQGGRQ